MRTSDSGTDWPGKKEGQGCWEFLFWEYTPCIGDSALYSAFELEVLSRYVQRVPCDGGWLQVSIMIPPLALLYYIRCLRGVCSGGQANQFKHQGS